MPKKEQNMQSLSKFVVLSAFLVSTGLVIAITAQAEECKQIHAQVVVAQTTTNCDSPVNLCTEGTIDGNQGLHGTTFFRADSLAAGPSTAPDAASTISYSGVLHITTDYGTLRSRDVGILNQSTDTPTGGFASAFGLVLEGTGRYAGATGSFFAGAKTIDGQFVTTVFTGEFCFP
jgi:hypothetical protein